MSDLQSANSAQRGARHPLLLYQRFNELLFWPSILIMVTCAVLLLWTPIELEPYRLHLSVALAGTALILFLTFAYRLTAYAQCRKDVLRIQLPLYHLTIPYEEITATRPTDFYRLFPPKKVPRLQRSFLYPLLGKTVVAVNLDGWPRPRLWLRLWMSRYMLSPESIGLIFPVRDWIAFRSELDNFRTQHRHYHY